MWQFTFAEGTVGYLCTRHKNMVGRGAGGKAVRLSDLPSFEWFPRTCHESSVRLAKPEPPEVRERRRVVAIVREEVAVVLGEITLSLTPSFAKGRRSA